MERKSCCSTWSYGCQTAKTVVVPKKEDVKPEVPKKEAAEPAKGTCGIPMVKSPKTEEKDSVPVKKEDVKPDVPKKEAAEPAKGTCGIPMVKSPKTEEKDSVPVKKEEHVKVNVGSGCRGFK